MKTMLLVHAEAALGALPIARFLSARRGAALIVLCVTASNERRLESCTLDGEAPSPLVSSARSALAGVEAPLPEVYHATGPDPRRTVIEALDELEADHLIVSELFSELGLSSSTLVGELLRTAPVDVLLFEPGKSESLPERLVFAQPADGGGRHALGLAASSFLDRELLLFVIPGTSNPGRARRTIQRALEPLDESKRERVTVVEPEAALPEQLAAFMQSGDMVLIDAESPADIRRMNPVIRRVRALQPGGSFSVGMTRAADAAVASWAQRIGDRFRRHIPKLDRDERLKLNERLDTDGRLSIDFLLMLVVSAAIAALGLIQNSTAVVIGAMLVAPLMTPILAMGMAMVQANLILFRASLLATAVGVLAAYVAAAGVGLTSPWNDLSAEIVARGGPNLFDLGIALLSGVAAAYALARTRLAGAMVGVAVAVALVPPLSASGIATVKGDAGIAFGAAMLFATNLCAIVLGAGLVFRLFGLDTALRGGRAPAWTRTAAAAFGIALLTISTLLAHNLSQQTREGVHRPYARPLPPALRASIRERVARQPGADILLMAESDIEHGFGTEVVLVVEGPVPESLRLDLLRMIRRERGLQEPARVLIVPAASISDQDR